MSIRRFTRRVSCILLCSMLAASSMAVCAGGCSGSSRRETKEQVAARLVEYDAFVRSQRDHFSRVMLARLADNYDRARADGSRFTFDVLAISAGGQYGAFTVGVLQGWQDEKFNGTDEQMPEFDVVTGVSTGALIAPFAYLGTPEDIRRIDQLYQEVDDRFVALRDLFFFLPWRVSFYDNHKLVQRIDKEMDARLLTKVRAASDDHRLLLIGTTDIDLGRMRVWDMGRLAGAYSAQEDPRKFRKVMLASAAIPAAFPPVMIDRAMYVDGGVTQQAFVGLDREQIEDVVREFRSQHPGAPAPTIRIWLIVNGSLDVPPESVPDEWVKVSMRSIDTMMKYSIRTTLRHLEFGVETLAERLATKVEFRYMCVPDSFPLPKTSDLFERKLMDALAAKGREMAREGTHWRRNVQSVELPGGDPSPLP